MPFNRVTSLAPIRMTAASGGGPATNMASTWPDKPLDVAPMIALVLNRIRLPVWSASPRAISTPGTSSAIRQPNHGCRRVTEDHQVQVDVHPTLPALHRGRRPGCTHRRPAAGRPTISG